MKHLFVSGGQYLILEWGEILDENIFHSSELHNHGTVPEASQQLER